MCSNLSSSPLGFLRYDHVSDCNDLSIKSKNDFKVRLVEYGSLIFFKKEFLNQIRVRIQLHLSDSTQNAFQFPCVVFALYCLFLQKSRHIFC